MTTTATTMGTIEQGCSKQENIFNKFNKYPYEHPSKHSEKLVKKYNASKSKHYESCYEDITPPPDDLECGYLGARAEKLWRQELDRKGPVKASLSLVLFKIMFWDYTFTLLWVIIVRLLMVLLSVESLKRTLESVDELKLAMDNEAQQIEAHIQARISNGTQIDGTEILSLGGESVEQAYHKMVSWLIALMIGLFGFLILYNNCKIQFVKCGLKCRVAMTQLIQRKSLRLHLATSIEHSSSRATSLISNEVTFIEEANKFLVYLIVGPIALVLASIWLARSQVNWEPVLLTIPVLSAFVAMQLYLPKVYKRISQRRKEQTNERIDVLTTFLNSVKVVKMYSWEEQFREKVRQLRRMELQQMICLDRFVLLDIIIMSIASKALSAIVFIACICFYGHLDSHILFTTVTAYNFWRFDGLYYFPKSIKSFSDLKTACKNIKQYLLLNEKQDGRIWVQAEDRRNEQRIKLCSKGICVSLESKLRLPERQQPSKMKGGNSIVPKFIALNRDDNATHTAHNVLSSSVPLRTDVNIIDGLDFDLEASDLTFIVGPVGCGKSTLLLTLLGETRITEGELSASEGARFAYASQEPCLFSDSFKNNILNGRPMDIDRYKKVVHVCSLVRDISLLPDEDETIVGPKGMSLSGGQKARLNLARAVYSQADIYLLDDPLSAVDTKVAAHVFTKCIKEMLSDKIVILATHQLQFLNESNKVIIMKRNMRPMFGKTSEMVLKEECQSLLEKFKRAKSSGEEDELEQKVDEQQQRPKENLQGDSCRHVDNAASAGVNGNNGNVNCSAGSVSNNNTNSYGNNSSNNTIGKQIVNPSSPLSTAEKTGGANSGSRAGAWRQEGLADKASAYLFALKIAYGPVGICLFCTYAILTGLINAASDYYFRIWSNKILESQEDDNISEEERFSYLIDYWLVFVLIVLLCGIITFLFDWQLTRGLRKASKRLHTLMVDSLFKAKVGFYDFCQLGELTSRYAGDLAIVDHVLPFNTLIVTSIVIGIVSTMVPTAIINPIQIIPYALILVICLPVGISKYRIQKVLMELSKTLRSPLYTELSSAIDELSTIRSEKDHLKNAQSKFNRSLNKLTSMTLLAGIYEQYLGTIIKLIVMAMISFMYYITFGVFWRDIDIATAGTFILLSYGAAGLFPAMLEYGSLLDSAMISMTNVKQYTELEPEVDLMSADAECSKSERKTCAGLASNSGNDPLAHLKVNYPTYPNKTSHGLATYSSNGGRARKIEWQVGQVSFNQVTLRYFEDEKPAIDRLTFTIEGGERVGVVGRTGAGKSSIISLLYRLYQFEGTISIDGVDTKTLSLAELRCSLGVIPQDPVLFCDSLRKNLDPFGAYTDSELWRALEIVNLRDYVSQTLSSGLEHMISEGGRNFSVGQRQLVCLARAVLRLPKVLLIDEATANVDADTDAFIQSTIRSQFTKSTIITIAHRLNTVLDYDRVMVLDAGRIVEFDTVQRLLQLKDGVFKSMLNQASG